MIHNKTKKGISHKKQTKIIGKIYANWCGHCKILKPQWKKMKNDLKNHPIEIVEIEVSEIARLEAFKKKHGVQDNGYPTIFKIMGKVEYYNGPRDAKSIKTWALSNKINGGKNSRKNNGKKI